VGDTNDVCGDHYMNFSEYQEQAKATAVFPGRGEFMGLAYCALGFAGEAGETANQVKKIARDDQTSRTPERLAKISHEIGDTLWYAAMLCNQLGLSLNEIAATNLAMLEARAHAGQLHGDGWKRGEEK
jgi:NTP pyrophosphatase (non-canonical NTP hydrolase)